MLLIIITLVLLLVYLMPILLNQYFVRKQQLKEIDLLSPMYLIVFFKIITIPYLIQLSYDKSHMNIQVLYSPWIDNIDLAIIKFMFIEMISIIFMLIGYYSSIGVKIAKIAPKVFNNPSKLNIQIALVATLLIGIGIYIYFMTSIGGIGYLWENMYKRTIITQGTGYLSSFYHTLLSLYLVLLIYFWKDNFNKTKFLFLVINFLLIAGIFSSTGRRGTVISLLILTIISFHYLVRRIRRIPIFKSIIIGVVLTFFIAAIPLFRTAGSVEYYQNNLEAFRTDVINNIGKIPSRLSTIDRQIVTFSYFSIDKIWLGKSYIDLFYAPIPRQIFQDKPPVDDGVYFKTIVEGQEIEPSLPANQLSRTSWPPGTTGIMFANFWFPGVMIGMFITGIIYRISYNYMINSNYSLFSILIYFYIIYGFGLSNYSLVNTIIKIFIIFITFLFFFKIRFTKNVSVNYFV